MLDWPWIIGGLVVVALVWIGWQTQRGMRMPALPPADPDSATVAQAQALIGQNQKILAIKLVRERTGMSLAQAKAWVDAAASAPAATRRAQEPIQAAASAWPAQAAAAASSAPDSVTLAEVQRLIAQDRKLEAIKLVRERTGMSLAQAKAWVEGQRVPADLQLDGAMTAALEAEVGVLLERKQTIQAIKLVREHTGMGLKEAKDVVDALAARR